MRAPQYSRFQPPKRASQRARGAGAPFIHEGMPDSRPVIVGPVNVQSKPCKVTLSLWHKSAKAMGYQGNRVMPVVSLPHDRQTAEPVRKLGAVRGPERKLRAERVRVHDPRLALAGTQAAKSDFPVTR